MCLSKNRIKRLLIKSKFTVQRKFKMSNIKTIDSVCAYCGVGCDIAAHVDTKENKIVKIFAHPDGAVSEGKLCIKGKFGYDFVDSEERIKVPRIRKSF